jgi:hypothetical protein
MYKCSPDSPFNFHFIIEANLLCPPFPPRERRERRVLPEGWVLPRQLTAVGRIGIGAAFPLARVPRRIAPARGERLVVEDIVEVAQAQTVVRSIGVHVVNVGHVQAES